MRAMFDGPGRFANRLLCWFGRMLDEFDDALEVDWLDGEGATELETR